MKTAFIALTLGLSCSTQIVASEINQTASQNESVIHVSTISRLSEVKKIYIAPLGHEFIRQQLINRLGKDGTFEVVDSPSEADATLTGIAGVNSRHYFFMSGTYARGGTKYSANGVFRLVSKDKRVLWSAELDSTKLLTLDRYVDSRLVNKLIARLKSAVVADREKIAATPQTVR